MGKKIPVRELPSGRFQKWGFGLSSINYSEWQPRIDAATTVLNILDGNAAPAKNAAVLDALSVVKGLFERQYLADRYDWFTTARFTGYPSPALASAISDDFHAVRDRILNDDANAMNMALQRLRDSHVDGMLEGYLDMTVRAQYPEDEVGFAYILFSTSEKEALAIGATEGHVDDVLKGLQKDYGDNDPYGVAAAYLVNDPERTAALLKKAFRRHYMNDGFYRIGLGDARDRLEEVLTAAHEIVASPWHVESDEEELEVSAPKMAAA